MRGDRRCGAHNPAGSGSGGVGRWCGAKQQCQCAALRCRERKPPHRYPVDSADAHFTDHRIDGATAQCLFHCPKQISTMRGAQRHKPFGRKTESIKTATMRRSAFGERHILCDPEQTG